MVCGPTPLTGGRYSRIALVAETAADARDVMVEGDSGILGVHPKAFRPHYEPSKRRLTWPNGAVATLFNATEPDQLRGPQHDLGWCDELAKWQYARETYDQLQFGMRLGRRPLQCITTTPRNIPVLREIIQDPGTRVTKGSTMDNAANLAPTFMKKVVARYAGTRLGRQELNAELLTDIQGALWNREVIDASRVAQHEVPPMKRIVVAVDPSGTKGKVDPDKEAGDTVGIIVAGLGIDQHGYILVDGSVSGPPNEWGSRAVDLYHKMKADRLVAEINYGGAMVEHIIRTIDPLISYREVKASRGKAVRAEPVSALYEQGRIHHVGSLPDLEDQLCLMSPGGYEGEGSPDRLDAMVWAITDLLLDANGYTLEDLRKAVS